MLTAINILIFILGASVGSFLSVIVARFGKDQFLTGRSRCPNCNKNIPSTDLIPILSYLIRAGKCRHCRESISPTYPFIEIITGVSFLLLYLAVGQSWLLLIINAAIAACLILIIFIDARIFIIPDEVLVILICLSIVRHLIVGSFSPISILVGLLLGGIFAILYIISKGEWAGLGDAKLSFTIGFLFGYPLGIAVFLGAIWVGAIIGICFILFKRASLKTALPFGTFLASMALIALIFAHELQFINHILFF